MIDPDQGGGDICRVCRSEGVSDRPLFHPCICTGSIKWIHQECLVQWMRYSRKEYCELCGHRFSFTPIYSPDMPRRLPFKDLAGGLLTSVATAVKYWLHYTLVAIAWLGIVPLTACRSYRILFSGNVDTILANLLSAENLASDIFHGCFVVTCTLFAFIGLVWVREQILHGGGPDWLDRDNVPPAQDEVPPAGNNNIPEENAFANGPENQVVNAAVPAVENPPPDNPNVAEQAQEEPENNAGNLLLY